MSSFDFLKAYVTSDVAGESDRKHTLYPLSFQDVVKAEQRVGRPFPRELRAFFAEIGYGFFCNDDRQGFYRLMDPSSIADFRLNEGIYQGSFDREYYNDPARLVFFEVVEGSYLTLHLEAENARGECPVLHFDKRIAESLEDFLTRLDAATDYFMR